MPRKPAQPSYTGVSWLDISQAMESAELDYKQGRITVMLSPNGLGIFELHIEHHYQCEVGEHLSMTTEPWGPSKGRLEAFIYRSIIDTLKESDLELARCKNKLVVHE